MLLFLGWEIRGRGLVWSDNGLFGMGCSVCVQKLPHVCCNPLSMYFHMHPRAWAVVLGVYVVVGYGGSPVPSDG